MGSISYSHLGRPALLDLAVHLYESYRNNPLECTRATVLLPTRRSVRMLEELLFCRVFVLLATLMTRNWN
jgi:hypothetical protein